VTQKHESDGQKPNALHGILPKSGASYGAILAQTVLKNEVILPQFLVNGVKVNLDVFGGVLPGAPIRKKTEKNF